jgi:hypothetical protein
MGSFIKGLIAIAIGATWGFLIKLAVTKKCANRKNDKRVPEVVLIIECFENQLEMVKDILWSNKALGVSKLG